MSVAVFHACIGRVVISRGASSEVFWWRNYRPGRSTVWRCRRQGTGKILSSL